MFRPKEAKHTPELSTEDELKFEHNPKPNRKSDKITRKPYTGSPEDLERWEGFTGDDGLRELLIYRAVLFEAFWDTTIDISDYAGLHVASRLCISFNLHAQLPLVISDISDVEDIFHYPILPKHYDLILITPVGKDTEKQLSHQKIWSER
ncbi:hypothetical protein ANO14919_130600 [Xylariales sp. No.14919]|nr:hypothetical protein ANO14919_130600 [Xylariales sp. No.14919]